MKKSVFTLVMALVASLCGHMAQATHIVGGEFELHHVGDTGQYLYRLDMILYFDQENGDAGAEDDVVNVYFFAKRNDSLVLGADLFRVSSRLVDYTNQDCAIGDLVTRRINYSALLQLDSSIFNDPEGYYVSYQRCCRNNTITNIVAPWNAGQVFYLELPPVVDSAGQPFVNNSPTLFPPLSDYGCVDKWYYTDFAGTDPDGDSLSYRLSTPLNGFTDGNVPVLDIGISGPYPRVIWQFGFDSTRQVIGTPSLNISPEGFLTVKPSQAGLYVFSVVAEEWRDSVKIGEVRRDFQMLVNAGCDTSTPPVAAVQLPGENFFRRGEVTVNFRAEEAKCLNFVITDLDGSGGEPEDVTIEAHPVNFSEDVSTILSLNSGTIEGRTDSLKLQICVPDCPFLEDEPYIIDVVAKDDACALPLLDTLRLIFNVEAPFNNDPFFVDDDIALTINEGEQLNIPLQARDLDPDQLLVALEETDFPFEEYGMVFDTTRNELGAVDLVFRWDSRCELYDFQTHDYFEVPLSVEDVDTCGFVDADTTWLRIQVNTPPNTEPEIATDLPGQDTASVRLKSSLSFNVFGTDLDLDSIKLSAVGDGFLLEDLGMTFTSNDGRGAANGRFVWNTTACNTVDLDLRDEYTVYFMVEDSDKCTFVNADTIAVSIAVLPPPNSKPRLTINSQEDSTSFVVPIEGSQVLNCLGTDSDADSLWLELLTTDSLVAQLFPFQTIVGRGQVSVSFPITPDCQYLLDGYLPKEYDLTFLVRDGVCFNEKADTVTAHVTIIDRVSNHDQFRPANIITPNGDGKNDAWTLVGHANPAHNLPLDNCQWQFERVLIVNRWGRPVFESPNPEFSWSAEGMPSGAYFYSLEYTNDRSYKGTITVQR